MTKSVSLRTTDSGTTYDKQKSETFYYIGYGKGDEIADYSINYNWDSTAQRPSRPSSTAPRTPPPMPPA